MKTKNAVVVSIVGAIVALTLTGCVATWTPGGVVVSGPPPLVIEPPIVEVSPVGVAVGVPDEYTWDGYEYVGIVGGQYVYLGPVGVWGVCEPWRLDRFHGWERGHSDWRSHAFHGRGGHGRR